MKINDSTLLFHPQSNTYPVSLSMVRQALVGIRIAEGDDPESFGTVSLAAEPEEEEVALFGYVVVHPIAPPEGDVVSEALPALNPQSGRFEQVWTVREYNTQELEVILAMKKNELQALLALLREQTLDKGYLYTFPDNSTGHVQLRGGDRANITGLSARAERSKAAADNKVFYFRTYENETKGPLTADDVIALSETCFDKYMEILQVCWQLKDQIEQATTLAGLPTLPSTIEV